MADSPTLIVMKRLIAKYNKDLKMTGYTTKKKAEIHALVKSKKYRFQKRSNDEWDLIPNAEMKRQGKYTYNKKTKAGSKKTYKK